MKFPERPQMDSDRSLYEVGRIARLTVTLAAAACLAVAQTEARPKQAAPKLIGSTEIRPKHAQDVLRLNNELLSVHARVRESAADAGASLRSDGVALLLARATHLN